MSQLQVRQLFDAKAATWPSKYAPDGRLAGRLTRLADAVAYHVPAGGSVLDLGCGTGELAIALAASGMRATGCDISPEMLRIAAGADAPGTVDWVELEPGWRVLPFRRRDVRRGGRLERPRVRRRSSGRAARMPSRAAPRRHRALHRPGPAPPGPLAGVADSASWPGSRCSARLAAAGPGWTAYLTYLQISRQRHSSAVVARRRRAGRSPRDSLPNPFAGALATPPAHLPATREMRNST